MDLKSFTQAIQQIADEKGISKEKILETIEMALAAAYKRDYGKRSQIIHAKLNPESGNVEIRQIKIVVDESMIKSEEEIALKKAKRAALTQVRAGLAPEGREARLTEEKQSEERKKREAEDDTPAAEKKVRFS